MLNIILFGTIWGFVEALLGGFLHYARLPLTGQILAPIAFGIMYLAMKSGLKPHQTVVIAVIAASFKFFDVILFSTPFTDIHIINPAQAIVMQGLVFAVMAKTIDRPYLKAVLFIPTATLMFCLVSIATFGYDLTSPNGTIWQTFVPKMPIGITLTCLVTAAIREKTVNISSISYAWKIAASVLLAATAVLLRGLLA